ncbi:ankyrin repeat-containing protein At2g01680 [Cajanus cajan]|uniref:Ankyrin repeat-containing protein At2g01680 family n=1 Tax=Cajanus cajan TaxID=3821 RepID=A0A151S3W2_CAJCA|nr:ankyrin repeat-containing protein At2g01680 [Cajanus cajan]KYP49492.1 Ankyrin repeat-containing protein At2g01680 family [Cajanus cajan]
MDSKAMCFITHQALFNAVRCGDLEGIKEQLQNKGESSTEVMCLQNDAGETMLYIAAELGLREVFSFLLSLCDVEVLKIRSKSDMSPFHVAAKRGHLDIVREILSTWPEVCKLCDSSDTSPLYSAAVRDHLDIVNAILDVDMSSMMIVRKNGKTALHNAARYGILRIVQALIARDPGIVCIKDKKGQTALHMAVKGQSTSVVEEILQADPMILNEIDKKGSTALHMATRKGRSQIVSLLLTYTATNVNAINNQKETALDLADKLPYGDSSLEIKEALAECGAKHARHIGKVNDAMELKRAVSDIKHEVQSQLIQNEKTRRRVSGIAKELKKIHRDAVQNTINSVTVVAVLFGSIAFMALFSLPGQYRKKQPEAGKANIAGDVAFSVFCLLNATALFISLAVVVVQITLVAWDTRAQRQVVSVVNKLMWAACSCTCGAFLAIAFVVVGDETWLAISVTLLGAPILVGTLAYLCYFVFKRHFGPRSDSQRLVKRASGSKSFSWTYSVNISDVDDYDSDLEKIYAL